MIIKLHEKAPKCPKCKVPMSFERVDQEMCEDGSDKSKFGIKNFDLICTNLYRCPKCLDIYEVHLGELK